MLYPILLLSFCLHLPVFKAHAGTPLLTPSQAERVLARKTLALAYFQAQLLPYAQAEVTVALSISPLDPELLSLKALILQYQNQVLLAEQFFLHAQALAPLNPQIAHHFGVFYCQLSRFQDAEIQFKRALSHSEGYEKDKTAWIWGHCLLLNEQWVQAHEVLSETLIRQPLFISDSLRLVELKMRLGRLQEAEKILMSINDSPSVSAQSLGLSVVLAHRQNQTGQKIHWGKLLGLHFSNSAQWRAYQEGTLHD
jgi:type IV pilus assembly protein PilF